MAKKGKYGVSFFNPKHPMNKGDASLERVAEYCINCVYCHPRAVSKKVAEINMSDWGTPKPKNALLKCTHIRIGITQNKKGLLVGRKAEPAESKVYVKPLLITKATIGKCKLLQLQQLRPYWQRLWSPGKNKI